MNRVIIIGDSTHNTLSVVRGLGAAKIPFTLILKGDEDECHVAGSRYVRRNSLSRISAIDECQVVLDGLESGTIICTFDEAAEWIDAREPELSKRFVTPCRGKRIGNLFNKDAQCDLARRCGLTVPESIMFRRGDSMESLPVPYPIILKPLYSTRGEKSDIHICRDDADLRNALAATSQCDDFILQEFVDKEYELNCLGVRGENGIVVPGGIVKKRHYPLITGACSFGEYRKKDELDVDFEGLERFLEAAGYHGPFSAEFLHTKDGKNFFMEVNFRNDGLAQTATNAGANLHALYIDPSRKFNPAKVRSIHMMNFSIDRLHVGEGRLTNFRWWCDFVRTRCFINASFRDPMPLVAHYLNKLHLNK